MFEAVDKIAKKISKIALILITIIGIAMLFITLLSVFCRYVLHNSLQWGEEVLKIMLVWFGLLSVGVIAYRRQHVGVSIFKENLPASVRRTCEIISQILMLVSSVAMCVIGVLLVLKSGYQLTPALRIPYAVGYWAIPVSFALMIIYEVRNLIYELTAAGKKLSKEASAVPGEVKKDG